MPWTQIYDPFGNPWLSTLIAALPTILLLGLLASGRASAHVAALAGLLAALVTAIFFYVPEMPDASYGQRVLAWTPAMLGAAGYGAAFGLLPIGWIVLAAIFLYNLTVSTGHFEIVKHSVASLSDDRRIQALLIAFSFGAFVEGAAGFGTPVAISAALMMGAGFKPLYAACLALLANTSPVAFGALGTPILTLAEITGLDLLSLSAMAGRQLPFFSLIIPTWLVWVMAGWRGVLGVWPALLVCGGSFAFVQFAVANWHGPWLVDVAGGLVSLISLAVFLRFWQPKTSWHFADETPAHTSKIIGNEVIEGSGEELNSDEVIGEKTIGKETIPGAQVAPLSTGTPGERGGGEGAGTARRLDPLTPSHSPPSTRESGFPHLTTNTHYKRKQVVLAWIPWLLLTILVFVWGLPQTKSQLGAATRLSIPIAGLHEQVARTYPVVTQQESGKPEKAIYAFEWLAATGTGIFIAAILSAFWLRISPRRFIRVFLLTCGSMRWPLFTIACMLAIAFTTRYSGMDATLGLAFTRTGFLYPLFAALLGWLGVALTGSDTSSNALFGSLQTITATQLVETGTLPLDVGQAKILLATANSTGGVMGKMIDAQSIVVAAVATGRHGQEGPILRFVFWHSLILAILMGALVLFQAYVWTAAIP